MKLNLLLTSIFAVGFAIFSAATHADESDYVYTEKKQNILVTSDHSEFTLKLRSNPTTGFAWFLREYNSKLISPVKHSYQSPDKKLIGAGGFDLWTFRVVRSGFMVPQQTTIRMVYTRPWESDTSGTQVVFRVSTQQEKME